ncbi:hypothetical protein [Methylorubrum extorquens]
MESAFRFTLASGKYTIRNRCPHNGHYLNVFQGRNKHQADTWREALKRLNDRRIYGPKALDGYAFAGPTRIHFPITLEHLIRLRDEKLLGKDDRLHFLGTGHPEVACVLTVIQEELRRSLGGSLLITFDSASPFRIAGEYHEAYEITSTSPRYHVRAIEMPKGPQFVGSDLPWPVSSPIADRLTLGDLNAKCTGRSTWDSTSHALVAAHNVWTLHQAINLANRRMSLPVELASQWLPLHIIDVGEKIRAVLRSETPLSLIKRWEPELGSLRTRARDNKLDDHAR